MVIDCHIHINRFREQPVKIILDMMDTYQVDKAVVFPGTEVLPDNQWMADIIKPHRDRLIPFAWLNPIFDTQKAVTELNRMVEDHGFKGIKLHPLFHAFYPNRPYVHKLVERCIEYGIPVLFHSGHAPYSAPHQIAELAAEYPEAVIIMDHMGYQIGWVDDAILEAQKYKNIILGTTCMPFHEKIQYAVRNVDKYRVIYGSDAPSIHMLPEIDRIKVAGLTPEEMELVMGGNIARLLGLNA